MKQARKSSSLLLVITGVIVVALMVAVAMMTVTLVEEKSSNAAEPSISCQEFAYTSFDGSNSQGVEAIQHLNETAGEGSVSMDREGPNTFGPEVLTTDVQSVQKLLSAIRLCQDGSYVDSHIMAVHMAAWTQAMSEAGQSGVQHPTSLEEVNSFADKLTKDVALRQEVALELIALESASKASIEEAAKGVWSLYMVDVDEVITIHQGQTIQAGPAIAFKHPSGAKVSYRLGCFFQPFGQKEFPGINKIIPPPPPPPTTPSITPEEELEDKYPGVDPAAQGNGPEGESQNYDPGPGEQTIPDRNPPPVYVPPKKPEVTVTNPDIQVDTTPPPEKEEEAPSVDEPATGCVIPPGETSC